MKLVFTVLVPVLLFSCAQKTSTEDLTEDQKKRMHDEIQPLIEQIYDAGAQADTTKLFEVFHFADNDFTYMEITGALYTQAQYVEMVRQFYGMISTEIIDKGKEKFDYINEDNVMWTYSGVLTAVYKTGIKERYDPFGLTILFRKKNNKWKAVFLQESTQVPVTDSTKH